MMTTQEKIILAAVKALDGTIHAGNNHGDALNICRMNGAKYDASSRDNQGFFTNKYRYVNRQEGGKIAFAAGQTTELKDMLFSEDITGNYPWLKDEIASLKSKIEQQAAEIETLRTKLGKAVGIIKRTMKSIASGKEARKMYDALHNEIYEIGPRPEINSTKKCCRDETKPCTGCLACCG